MDTFAATVHLEVGPVGDEKDKCLADDVVAMAQQK